MHHPFVTPPSHDFPSTETINVRKEIRQESNDVYNRLHSIAEDATFISQIARLYPAFKMFANLRCGAWYVEPEISQTNPVYFKSTDGHFGKWAFNLRRANLHLLDAVMQRGGIILVDSTRHGKRFPDAMSKTVPIWCAVINLVVARSSKEPSWTAPGSKVKYGLYTSPMSVSRSEHAQIESHLDEWAKNLLSSEYLIPHLRKPLRPIWITPDNHAFPLLDSLDFFPVVCVSASKLIQEGAERRSAGYTYVQGSGDDHESWSQGLTPDLFWQHHAKLLASPRSTLPTLISSLVASVPRHHTAGNPNITPVSRVKSRLAVGMARNLPLTTPLDRKAYVVVTSQPFCISGLPSNILLLQTSSKKNGQHRFVTQILPQSLDFLRHHLVLGDDVAVVCDDGKDISVGVAVAALSLLFDDEGTCVANTPTANPRTLTIEIMIQNDKSVFQQPRIQPRDVCNGFWPTIPKPIPAGRPSKE